MIVEGGRSRSHVKVIKNIVPICSGIRYDLLSIVFKQNHNNFQLSNFFHEIPPPAQSCITVSGDKMYQINQQGTVYI